MNKPVLILVAILIFILSFILILMAVLTPQQDTVPDLNSSSKAIPTKTPFFINPFRKKTPTPTPKNPHIAFTQLSEQLIKKTYETTDFKASYSPELKKIIIEKKNESALPKIQAWLRENGLDELSKDSSKFTIIDQKNKTNISQTQKDALNTFKEKMPMYDPDIIIKYEKETDSLIVDYQNNPEQGEKRLEEIARENNIPSDIINNRDLIIVKDPSNDLSFVGENQPQNNGIIYSPDAPSYPNRQNVTPSYQYPIATATPSHQQKQINDYFVTTLQSLFENYSDISPTTTPRPTNIASTTPQPGITNASSSPSSTPQPTTGSNNPPISTDPNIINQALRIVPNLQKATWNMYNRLVTRISNGSYTTPYREGATSDCTNGACVGNRGLFWCTNIVISAYNLAGIRGLNENHQGVISMRQYWMNASGYKYVDYYQSDKIQALRQVQPGCAFFFELIPGVRKGAEHTGLVKKVTMDSQGNGTLETIESNNSRIQISYPISQGNVRNTPRGMQVVGFGCR